MIRYNKSELELKEMLEKSYFAITERSGDLSLDEDLE